MKITESRLRGIIRQVIKENDLIAQSSRDEENRKISNKKSINFEKDDTSQQEGGIFEEFYKQQFALNNLLNPKAAWDFLGHQRINKKHKDENLEISGLDMNDKGKFKDLREREFDKGIYYVTNTGVWCYAFIPNHSSGNNSRDLDKFKAFLLSDKNFKQV